MEDFKEPVSRFSNPLFERPCHTGDLRRQGLDMSAIIVCRSLTRGIGFTARIVPSLEKSRYSKLSSKMVIVWLTAVD